ncbi:peptidase U4 sporulation factor SpoIIGA [Mycoplasma sp. CAG:956]|nr:peptidase U4 sporulation factor SpoIIGA [Mycoplasma sp. CAG:956]
MTIYIDLVILLNYFFDSLILLTVNTTLKRNISLKKILFVSLLGELSLLGFLLSNKYLLILLKLEISVILNILTFKYKDIFYTATNILYFYMVSIILGGFIYYLKLNNLSYFFILLLVPLILYLYIKQNLNMKTTINKTYPLTIYFPNKRKLSLTGFVDTGNKLRDPVTKKWVVLVNKKLLQGVIRIRTPIYVPYHSLNNKGLVECIKPEKLVIEGKEYTNFLIGLMDSKVMINSSDCILNLEILEELSV